MTTKAERAARVQEDIKSLLLLTHPFTELDVVIAALTYEIARIVGQQMPPDVNVDEVLAGVQATMKEQILLHRSGHLKE